MNIAPNHAMPTARRWTVMALSLGGVALVAACGSLGNTGSGSSSTSAPAASASPATSGNGSAGAIAGVPCTEITALRSTLTDLSHTSASPTSAGRIAVDLSKAQQELDALKSQSGTAFSAQANELSSELAAIKATADTLAHNPTPANVANLTNAVNSFKATAQPLIKEMQAVCP